MVQTYPIAETVTTLIEAESKFGLTLSSQPDFFWEWSVDLSKLTESEQIRLDLIKQRYQYHRKYGQLAESTVNAIIMSPLLELAGFFDPPFRLRSEVSVKFEVEDKDEILRGRIDSWVVLDRLRFQNFLHKQAPPLIFNHLEASSMIQRLSWIIFKDFQLNSIFPSLTGNAFNKFHQCCTNSTPTNLLN
ncbi:MAG: phage tail protein [Pseudanabaenales cyanobacterium]|nr:phage tail protein [Pseudanabaenales cyanobacterium]